MRYVRTFLKHWYLYIIPILLFPAIATVYGYTVLLTYQSTALLWVDKPVFLTTQDFGWDPYQSAAQNEATAMTELLQSEPFDVSVAANTDLAHILNLNTRYGKDTATTRIEAEVTVLPTGVGPHSIKLIVTDKSPQLSLQLAQALITAYINQYQSNRLQLDQQAISYYQTLAATTQGLVTQDAQKVQDYLHAHPDVNPALSTDPNLAQLETQLQQDQQGLDAQNTQITGLRQDMLATNQATGNLFQVKNPPQLPLSTSLSKKSLAITYTGGGLGVALALVGLIVAGLTQLDRKVYLKRDLELIADSLEVDFPQIEALPVLAGVGRIGHKTSTSAGYEIDGILIPALAALPRPRAVEGSPVTRDVSGQRVSPSPHGAQGEDQG